MSIRTSTRVGCELPARLSCGLGSPWGNRLSQVLTSFIPFFPSSKGLPETALPPPPHRKQLPSASGSCLPTRPKSLGAHLPPGVPSLLRKLSGSGSMGRCNKLPLSGRLSDNKFTSHGPGGRQSGSGVRARSGEGAVLGCRRQPWPCALWGKGLAACGAFDRAPTSPDLLTACLPKAPPH